MRILIVATKSPWPPRDGGRLALWLALQGLAKAGHELTLVAPVDTPAEAIADATLEALRSVCAPHLVVAGRRSWLAAVVNALREGCALTVARHRLPAVEQKVAQCIASWRPEVVHVEQLQALANCCGVAAAAGIPVLLRMQNVESSLWFQVARARLSSAPLWLEARRLRRDETCAIASVARVVALTERDATEFKSRIEPSAHVRIKAIAPPFPSVLESAEPIDGEPAVVLAGSAGWWPNHQGMRWFLDAVAPRLSKLLPAARIHVYGGAKIERPGVVYHDAPDDAVDAFPAGAIAAIPLHIGSGIRMRILEAWARGLPVVATSTAAAGLDVIAERELLIADTPEDFARAIGRLHQDKTLSAALIAAGCAYLVRHHDSAALTQALIVEYQRALLWERPPAAKLLLLS